MHFLRQPVTRAPVDEPNSVVCLVVMLFGYIPERSVAAQPLQQHSKVNLSHLDSGLLVDAEQGNVGNTNESPFLVWPKHDDRSSLWSLGRNVKVGEANATQVGSETDEDVPSTV